MATNQAYARLQREDWDKLGPTALALELFTILNTAGAGSSGSGSGSGTGSGGSQQVFQGTIVSGGPGANYQVQLDNNETVAAVQTSIDAGETIPAGTITSVYLLADGTYRISVPTWE